MYQAAPIRSRSSGSIPGRVGAVDERLDAALGEGGDDPLDREDERRRARDMADQGEPSPVGDRGRAGRSTTASSDATGNGISGDDDPGAVALGDVAQDVDRGVVLVVVGQQLVAGLEAERAEDRVDGAGRIRDEREVVRVGPDEGPEVAPSRGQQAGQVAGEELDGLRLHPVATPALGLEDGPRARPERAVVQERDRGVEGPRGGVLGRHRQMMTGTLGPWVP